MSEHQNDFCASPSPVTEGPTGSSRPHPDGAAQWENFREWVAMALNVFLAPDGLVATDETIDTFAQVLECRVREINGELLAALKAVANDRHACGAMKHRAIAAIAHAEGRS